jgi:regulator of replication initiation timing
MEYIGYAGLFTLGMLAGVIVTAVRMSASYKKLEEYSNHTRCVLQATDKRYTDLSSENSRLRVKNYHLQSQLTELTEQRQYQEAR